MARIVIIVPTYNRAHCVSRAIDSALAQERRDLGVLVVDDGSTDRTGEVLARYAGDARVRIVRCPTNRGVTAAKNVGLDHLPEDCELFGILDSDDLLFSGAIDRLARVFDDGGDYSQVLGWCEDPATGARTGAVPSQIVTYEDALRGRLEGEFWQLARADLLGDLRFEERASGGESSLWWPLLKKAPAFVVDGVVRAYERSGADRVSRPRFDPASSVRHMWVYRAQLDAAGDDLRRLCPERYADLRLEEAKWAAIGGRKREALGALLRAAGAHPSPRTARIAALALLPPGVLRRYYERRYASPRG
jgi:glycosyltransferase involved in cell wall biosynthesis